MDDDKGKENFFFSQLKESDELQLKEEDQDIEKEPTIKARKDAISSL